MPDTSPESPANAGEWLSIAVAAARLGVSARAIQKRAERGTLTARRVKHGGASRWEVDGRELGANHSPDVRQMDANSANSERETVRETGANRSLDGREPTSTSPDFAAKYLAQLESENEFLRRALEAAQQSEAVTKAALRELLKAQPKQLSAGHSSTNGAATSDEQLTQVNAEKSARTPQNGPQSGEAGNDGQQAANGGEIAPERDEAPVSYGSIADELERMLNK